MAKAPNIVLKQLRGSSIPQGFLLGRASAGTGAIELVSQAQLQASGLIPKIPTTLPPSGPAGGDLTGTYPNPGVGKLLGRLLNTTAPVSGQVMVWDGTKITWENQSGGVIIGSGAPSALEPAGTLYSQSDADAVWSSQPTTVSPAIVQSSQQDNNISPPNPKAITFSSGVTAGNLLIAIISEGGNTIPTAATGWTLESSVTESTNCYMALYTRIASGGDGTTPPAVVTNGAGNSSSWFNYEISGATWAALDGSVVKAGVPSPSGTTVMSSFTPSASGDLVIAMVSNFKASLANQPTVGSPFSASQQGDFFRTAGWLGHDNSPPAGTPIAATITWGSGSTTGVYMVFGLGSTSSANWDLVGPQVLPTGANPTATAGPAAVNGSASTFMRSDAAPAVQKASASQFGIVEVDGTTIKATAGVISAIAPNPYMCVQQQSAQALSGAAYNKVLFDTVLFDPGNYWSAANHRWVPQVAGKYKISGTAYIQCNGTTASISGSQILLALLKNGAPGVGTVVAVGNNSPSAPTASTTYGSTSTEVIVSLNGTTDFLEMYIYTDNTNATIIAASNAVMLTAIYLGP